MAAPTSKSALGKNLMRIDRLLVKDFKGFEEREFSFHPQFNPVVGVNGTGKTSVLEALSVALGGWFLGLRGYDTRHIRPQEVQLIAFQITDMSSPQRPDLGTHWAAQFPCRIRATGEVLGQKVSWLRSLNTPGGRTTYVDAREIKDLAARTEATVHSGGTILLPLLSYYGTGRLWDVPRGQSQIKDEKSLTRKETRSRLAGYRNSVDPRLSVADLVRWIAREAWIAFQDGGQPSPLSMAVTKAILGCIEGAADLYFDSKRGEIIIRCRQWGNSRLTISAMGSAACWHWWATSRKRR
jgi:predicted ATP-binding protein involved in virulence